MKKIFILLGHPDTDETFCKSLADAYEKGAKVAGYDVRRMNIAEMKFDPILHKGYKVIQSFEPDIVSFQENIKWCDHFVVIYPTWWTNVPALLKGLFDRAWISGFAFRFRPSGLWSKLLFGKSARIITTMGAPVFFERLLFGKVTRMLSNNILKFAGFKVFETWVGNAEKIGIEKKQKWIAKIDKLGSLAK